MAVVLHLATGAGTATAWACIAERAKHWRGEGHAVWIVSGALPGAVQTVRHALDAALADRPDASIEVLRRQHDAAAVALGLPAHAEVQARLDELSRLLDGIRLTREASPRLVARLLSFGELAATHLAHAGLHAHGLEVERVDVRTVLRSEGGYLDGRGILPEPIRDVAPLVITQSHLARTEDGHTARLGAGGGDTSATLLAAHIGAEHVELWTDVHGLFSADPRLQPTARLIRSLHYRQAQELAAMDPSALHPRCLGPAAARGMSLEIRHIDAPEIPGTRISDASSAAPALMAVVQRRGATLLTVSTLDMLGTPGFLSKVFTPFAELGISVDLVATSASAVSLTLDALPGGPGGPTMSALLARLEPLGAVAVVHPAAVVSIIGRHIRTVLHELGPAMSVFADRKVHLVSESAEDLNLSFVVEEADAPRLAAGLHDHLLPKQGADSIFGPSWESLTATPDQPHVQPRWWHDRVPELLTLCPDGAPRYVYDLATVRARARALMTELPSVDAVYYAMKANGHPEILEVVASEGLGIECVSAGEVLAVRRLLGDAIPILFTPNFCDVAEYALALEHGAEVTLDGPHLFEAAPDTFSGVDLAVRVDPGGGMGHHDKVVTAGAHAKFGHPIADVDAVVHAAARHRARLVGLHSHVGSGILDPAAWGRTLAGLTRITRQLPDLRWVDIGGGLGVPERPRQRALDLVAVERGLAGLRRTLGAVELRIEPGRYLVAEAGVLLAPVTQVRSKGSVRFVGVNTGMNSLLRPALYGSWHGIHNLTRLSEAPVGYSHVVGPICESGDVLGRDRRLPRTHPGDLLLIDHVGAYGRVMSSSYNMRAPAEEVCLG